VSLVQPTSRPCPITFNARNFSINSHIHRMLINSTKFTILVTDYIAKFSNQNFA
jgi:hypothetical protein